VRIEGRKERSGKEEGREGQGRKIEGEKKKSKG
jgi:hypothetical protein